MMHRKYLIALLASVAMTPASAQISLLTDSSGGYGQVAMERNDDGSTSVLDLPFAINFYGTTYNQFYLNNNGNITFDTGMGTYTPFNLGNLSQAMIAPYWADVDTRAEGSGLVYVGSFAPGELNITWDNVGYYGAHDDKLNSFQLNIYKVGDAGDFDIEFRYNKLEWTTGDASDGINGLGGIPAVAGYTDGNGHSYMQPGSLLSPGALNMAVESNTDPAEGGRWIYNIRNDAIPPTQGSTPGVPILPTGGDPESGYEFTFNVSADTVYYYDPPVATGYDFSVVGANITSAIFPTLFADADGYQIFDLNGNLLGTVMPGGTFNFSTPLNFFRLRGIDAGLNLQPGDPTAFVFGLVYDQGGTVTVTQTPFVENIDAAVPEPASWAMMIGGFALAGASLRRRSSMRLRFA